MEKSLANQIAKLWNDNFAGSYEPTKTMAEVCVCTHGGYFVVVHPYGDENDGHAFYSHNEVSDIARAFRVSSYITQDENHRLCARIY